MQSRFRDDPDARVLFLAKRAVIAGAASSVTRCVMMKEGSILPRSIRSRSSGMYLCMWV